MKEKGENFDFYQIELTFVLKGGETEDDFFRYFAKYNAFRFENF